MKGNNFETPMIASTYGDAAAHPSSFTFAASATGTKVDMTKLPVGAQLYGVVIVNDALGTGVTLDVGVEFPYGDGTDDPNKYQSALAAASAGQRAVYFHPERFDAEGILTVTTAGGTAAGTITVMPLYRYLGTK